MDRLSRRDFIRVSALVGASTVVAACGGSQSTPEPTTAPAAEPTKAAESEPTGASARYSESPIFAEMVANGELPPVDERLPENPHVAMGLDGIGNYGGGWRMNKKGQADGYAAARSSSVACSERRSSGITSCWARAVTTRASNAPSPKTET